MNPSTLRILDANLNRAREALRRQVVHAFKPRDLALGAVLFRRRHRFRVIEAVNRDADAAGAVERVCELRAALIAEAALDEIRALKDR